MAGPSKSAVLAFLQRCYPGSFSAIQLSAAVGFSRQTVCSVLNRLAEEGQVEKLFKRRGISQRIRRQATVPYRWLPQDPGARRAVEVQGERGSGSA